MKFYVRKKAGNLENWNPEKIANAITKSANRINTVITDDEYGRIIGLIENRVFSLPDNVIEVATLHSYVETALQEIRPDVAKSYMDYRNWAKRNSEMMATIQAECQAIQFLGDKSNANADSALVSTKRVKKYEAYSKETYIEYFLNQKEIAAIMAGYIYIHDMASRSDTMNCCLFDVRNVLSDGFEMGNLWYNEPKSLDVAFDVIGDITLMAASQQYGGFTLPEVDKILAPYAQKSYEAYVEKYMSKCGMTKEAAEALATDDVIRDFEQGFQGWEYKFNSVASSRGDYPFITATFGLCTDKWGKEACKAILKVRKEGQGKKGFKKPVLFPKLVFLYDENIHGAGKIMEDVFEDGIDCSAKTMYPDWLSLTGDGYVPSIYKKYGLAISPMGCRAFLSPWYERGGMEPADEDDKPVFVGRFNIGAVSLNLPMIYAKAQRENRDFYEVLDYYLEMIRGIHKRTYDFLANMKASANPLGFCEGGFYGGHLGLNDKLGLDFLRPMTASFGITALNELQELYNQKSIREDGDFALEVIKYINEKITEYKKEDGWLYAIYGTPAETLCGKQIDQFRKEFGIITNVSDKPYVSNSFHCHVSENISPIEKQDKELRFWNYFNGGKIQYCRYHLGYNREAMKTLVLRAMKIGYYEGVNLSLAYCDDCGHEELEMDTCPVCGSKNLTKIDRMNGYLAFSRVHGDTRLNQAKMAEIADRTSM
jgi:ribonucleoside-triphosphate reductase